MSPKTDPLALKFAAWSRVFSPVVPDALRKEAWEALEIPLDFSTHTVPFTSTFLVGLPTPPVPLLLHAALHQEGSAVREAWVRVMEHLGMEWDKAPLPPDHLAVACELFAIALQEGENVLVSELIQRFLHPWCSIAMNQLAETIPVRIIPEIFAADLDLILQETNH